MLQPTRKEERSGERLAGKDTRHKGRNASQRRGPNWRSEESDEGFMNFWSRTRKGGRRDRAGLQHYL